MWKWPKLKILEIQKTNFKTRLEVSLKKIKIKTKIESYFWNRELDNINSNPIMALCWHSHVCPNFDLFDSCHSEKDFSDLHNHNHSLSLILVLDGSLEIVLSRRAKHALRELMKCDPHFNFNLWCSHPSFLISYNKWSILSNKCFLVT